MNTSLVYAEPTLTLEEALHTMEAHHVHHLLIHDADRVTGIVSDRDCRLLAASTDQACAPAAALRSLLAREAMNRSVVAVAPGATVTDAATLLLDHGVDALLVVDDGTLVGVISGRELLELWAGRPRPSSAARPGASPAGGVRHFRRVAIVGLQDDPAAAPVVQTAKLMSFGVTVFPIHRQADALLGVRCFARVASVPGAVDIVQVFPHPDLQLEEIVDDAITKKARMFWFEGPQLPEDLQRRLAAASIDVVVGRSLYAAYLGSRS